MQNVVSREEWLAAANLAKLGASELKAAVETAWAHAQPKKAKRRST